MSTPSVKPRKKEKKVCLVPGADSGWEAWSVSPEGQPKKLEETPLTDHQLSKWVATSFAIPARMVYSVPIWIYGLDEQANESAVTLQLESMDLMGKGRPSSVFDLSLVRKEPDRFLYSVGVLNRGLPAWAGTHHQNYDVSTRFFRFNEDQVTLWREQGRITVAFTRGSNVVHFQDLMAKSLTEKVISDLYCIKASLELRETVGQLRGICLWFSASPSEVKELESALGLPVVQEPKPNPIIPSQSWVLMPPEIVEAKKSARWRTWKWRAGLVAGGIYLFVVLILLLKLQMTYSAYAQNQKWLDDHQTIIDSIKKSDDAWTALNLILDQDHYPLENLMRCDAAIPGDDFHLTLFDQENGDFIVRGEGKNVTAAEIFSQKLQHDPLFKDYSWKVESPTILPNDLAQIELRAYAPTHQ